jgi:hypothetical protein
VIVRDSEMALHVECHGYQPYGIRGIDRGGLYEGFREGPGDVYVHATWTRQGDTCKGTWVEDDCHYTFSFRLKATSRPRTSK